MRLALAAVLGLLGAACVSESAGVEWARIDGPRFLGVSTGRPVAGFNDYVSLDALVVDEAGEPMTPLVWWRACNPWRRIEVPKLDCGQNESVRLSFGGYEADVILAAFPPPSGIPLYFNVPLIGETSVQGERLIVLKEVRTTRELFAPPRSNPSIAALLLDGAEVPSTLEPGRTYRLQVLLDYESIDLVDDGNGSVALEEVSLHVYVTAGDVSRSPIRYRDGIVVHERIDTATFTAPLDPDAEVIFWLVAVDGDGGTGWRRFPPTEEDGALD